LIGHIDLDSEDRSSDEEPTVKVARRVTGHLHVPTKKTGGSLLPSKPSTSRDHEEDTREFFVNLASLLLHVNASQQTAQLQQFYEGIQRMALHVKYPRKEWLSTLKESLEEEDHKVSKYRVK
jgi:hypothetical protein